MQPIGIFSNPAPSEGKRAKDNLFLAHQPRKQGNRIIRRKSGKTKRSESRAPIPSVSPGTTRRPQTAGTQSMPNKFESVAWPRAASASPPAQRVYTTQLETVVGRIAKKIRPGLQTGANPSHSETSQTSGKAAKKIKA